ncbi:MULTISPECIES: phosphatase PAP2 family protein [Rhodococcus]|uniref:phosphatase PAP2 family protein n=1 Tax=Rhodococcus TaxID=1827 RepID=UPI0020A3BFE0|nr:MULTISPECIES: phosphatase PAP2 family protein [Rhodococcus]MEA1798309.1 phosphatase PAP2 family protein [Rhodococcus qingshengii]
MKEVEPHSLSLVSAAGHGASVRMNLVGRAHDLVSGIHQGAAAAIALAVLVGGVALFSGASLWRSLPGTRRSAGTALICLQGAGLAAAFVALAYQVKAGDWLTSADPAVLGWFTGHRSDWVTGPAIAVTDAGGPVGTVVLAVVIGAVLSRRARSSIPALILIGTVGGAALVSTVTKSVVGRSRPPIASQVLLETDHSFPSGHATGAMALFMTAALLLGYAWSPARRALLLVTAAVVAVVVSVTRLYLGEHWLSDVIGGMLLGGLAAVIGGAIYTSWMARSHDRRSRALDASSTARDRNNPTTMGQPA